MVVQSEWPPLDTEITNIILVSSTISISQGAHVF
jgi:hypothetical protein